MMGKTRKAYSEKFREQMVRLVRAGRTPEDRGRELEPQSQSIRNWIKQRSSIKEFEVIS